MVDKTALVVDDSKSARFAVRKQLEHFGYGVALAETAEEAIVWLDTHRPDVIFLDFTLPGADGFEVLKRIKKNAKTVTIPVVICSSHEGGDFVQQARSKGAVDVMRKPPETEQIATVLKNVERAAEAFGTPPAREPLPGPAHPASSPTSKVQPIRPPEAAIEQRVMQTLRDAMTPPSSPSEPPVMPVAPPAVEPTAARGAADAQLRSLAQDLYAQLGELKARVVTLENTSVDPDQLRQIVQRELGNALSELQAELLKVAKATASDEAHAAAERAVMNAAGRVSEQMAQSLLKTLGHGAPAAGGHKR
jgi:CheY-like chemotaxis protein